MLKTLEPTIRPESPFAMSGTAVSIAAVLAHWLEAKPLITARDRAIYLKVAEEFVTNVLDERNRKGD